MKNNFHYHFNTPTYGGNTPQGPDGLNMLFAGLLTAAGSALYSWMVYYLNHLH